MQQVCRRSLVRSVAGILRVISTFAQGLSAQTAIEVSGQITDPQSHVVDSVPVTLTEQRTGRFWVAKTDGSGRFILQAPALGLYTVKVDAPRFQDVIRTIKVGAKSGTIVNLQLGNVARRQESVTV